MVDRKILRLTPKRFFCPMCGDWHDWEGERLQSYNSDNPYEYECSNCVELSFWFTEKGIHIRSSDLCEKINDCISADILFEDIECDEEEPVIKVSTCVYSDEIICSDECEHCCECNLPLIGDERSCYEDESKLKLEFKFEFPSGYLDEDTQREAEREQEEAEREQEEAKRQNEKLQEQITEVVRRETAKRQQEKAKREQEEAKRQQEKAKREQEEAKRQQKEAKLQKPIVTESQTKSKKGKEDITMANNIFNINMEFGPNKDDNIASTLIGIAVKNGNSWRIYDKKKKEITDVGDMQIGNLPIFILPTTKLSEGDLIKDAGEYYFVTKVVTSYNTSIQTLSARTGEMKSVLPIKNILGFNCYTKVIALSDLLNIDNDFDVEKLAIMSAMCGQTGGQINQLLPLMLFKDKLGGDDDTMKLLLMSSMTSEDDGGQMNQLLPLMLFKDELGGDDDTMKLLLMSYMMGDNMTGSNNPLMSYIMLDAFMGKKDDKAPQASDGAAK